MTITDAQLALEVGRLFHDVADLITTAVHEPDLAVNERRVTTLGALTTALEGLGHALVASRLDEEEFPSG